MIYVTCVYKIEPHRRFVVDDVHRLALAVKRNITIPYQFAVLTDAHGSVFDRSIIHHVGGLKHGLRGWWSKMELFEAWGPPLPTGDAMLYFDLDTVITGSIDGLAQSVIGGKKLMLLAPFAGIRPKYQTGIIGVPGSYDARWIFPAFKSGLRSPVNYIGRAEKPQIRMNGSTVRGDQEWFAKHHLRLTRNGGVTLFQSVTNGIYSYKHHLRDNHDQLPRDASVVCFHGDPRPRDAQAIPWVRENWGSA